MDHETIILKKRTVRVTKIIWGFSVNNWGLIWGLKVSLKFEKIKRDVELWLYRL